jgi:hypothetical protein
VRQQKRNSFEKKVMEDGGGGRAGMFSFWLNPTSNPTLMNAPNLGIIFHFGGEGLGRI